MKKYLATLVLLLCLIASYAFATTTFYGYTEPTVGGSANAWGGQLNTIITSIDSQMWTNVGGLNLAVNAPSSSGSNIVLANPIKNIQNLSFTTTGKNLTLPPMNATLSPVAGGSIYVNNVGSNPFEIFANDGSTAVVTSLAAGNTVQLQPLTNSTTNGTWTVLGPYLTSIGTLTLGSSAGAPNPANSTSGLFSATTTSVGVAVSGSQVASFLSTGLNSTAIGATTSSTALFTTATVQTAYILGGSIDGTTIGATTSSTALFSTITVGACNGCGVGNVTVQSFCASGCTHTAGTWTPTSGTKYVIVREVGGGGGGGGIGATPSDTAAGPGASGSYSEGTYAAATFGASQTITLGAGGLAGTNTGGNGGDGGASSFGALLTAPGGGGGLGYTTGSQNVGTSGVPGAAGTGGYFMVGGNSGGTGFTSASGSISAAGAASQLGGGGAPVNQSAGNAGTGYGSGGSGAAVNGAGTGLAGGAGTAGAVIITEYQ